MTIALIIYFISMLGDLSGFLVVLAVVLLFCSVSYFLYHLMEGKEPKNSKKFTMIMGLSVFLFALNVMIPKERTAWLMLGGYTLQTAYESEDGQKYRKLIMNKIDEAIGETAKAAQGEKAMTEELEALKERYRKHGLLLQGKGCTWEKTLTSKKSV